MNNIKIRAWDKEEQQMIVDEQSFIPAMVTNKGVFRLSERHVEDFWVLLPLERFELMQSTGLKDKNGLEIFEGDILEYYDLRKGVFVFKEQPKRREVISWNRNDAQFRIPDMGFRLDTDKVEVVGNAYENKELLK